MNWTNERPTAAGWYWWRALEHEDAKPCRLLDGGDLLYFNAKETWCRCPIRHLAGQFAGPIPEPRTASILDMVAATPFELLMGQIRSMKNRSELYEREAKDEGDMDASEKHMRVYCVLKELERLGKAFDAQK